MSYRGMYGRERTFQPDMQRAMEDCKGRQSLAGAAPTREFTPTDLSGLVDWHRSDLGLTLVGSKVSSWVDQSGAGHNLTQGTDANRPTFVGGVINGLPVLRFGPAAADIHMLWSAWARTPNITIYAVIRHVAQATYQLFMMTDDSSGAVYSGGDTTESAANEPNIYLAGPVPSTGAALVNATNYLVKWSWSQSGATLNVQVQVNNAAEVTGSATFTIGGNWTSLAHPTLQDWISDIAELAIYNRNTTADEDAAFWQYAQKRYNL